jgi:hypothetical protein
VGGKRGKLAATVAVTASTRRCARNRGSTTSTNRTASLKRHAAALEALKLVTLYPIAGIDRKRLVAGEGEALSAGRVAVSAGRVTASGIKALRAG